MLSARRLAAFTSVLLLYAATMHAADAVDEIQGLIQGLGSSGCEFERNGTWYDAARAQEHLQTKYEWLRKHDKVATPEQFIERAATESSMTGKPYHVRCKGQPVEASSAWFSRLLQHLRADEPSRTTR